MTQRSFLFGSVAGDRVYDPGAFARAFQRLISSGVVDGDGNNLNVIQNTPAAMNVKVDLGSAFVLGYFFEVYGAAEVVAIGAANATNPRIDRIVVRRDLAARTMALAVVAGAPAAVPAAPALTQNIAGVYEIPLAQVRVNAAVASIVTANITDERQYSLAELGTVMSTASGHDHDGTDSKRVSYADLTAIPALFQPGVHDHGVASAEGPIPYANLTGVPATFAPSAHTHDYTAQVTGKPATFAPSAHAAAHGAGGGDQVTVPWTSVSGKPGSFAPSAHGSTHRTGGGDTVPVYWGQIDSIPATFAPVDHYHNQVNYTGIYWAWIYDKPGTFPPSGHSLAFHGGSAYDIGGWNRPVGGVNIWNGGGDPGGSASEGDIWVKG